MTNIGTRLETLLVFVSVSLVLVACTSQGLSESIVHASAIGDVTEVTRLIGKGANIESHAIDDWTPLTVAARGGHLRVVELLVASGADVNASEGGGNTPLFWAAYNGHEHVVRFLLDRGADPKKKGKDGQLPLEIARKRGFPKIEQLISGVSAVQPSGNK